MGLDCPSCGRDDFESEHGLNIHHAKTHGESLMRVETECDQCGDIIEIHPYEDDGSDRFCSVDCFAEFRSEHYSGENAPAYRGGNVTLECAVCGEEYERNPAAAENSRFCSNQCRSVWLSKNHSGADNPLYKRVEKECDNCGDMFECYPYKYDQRRFCSSKCKEETFRGKNHPRWNGGKVYYYGENWYEQRRRALARDDGKCRVCGMGREKHQEEHGEDLHVHHIKPINKFEEPEDANTLENLITLCEPHHDQWEGLPVAPKR